MAKKRYQLTLTDTTHRLVCSLEQRGHNVRDILNAGIVLYDQADNAQKAKAHMTAYNNLPEEVADLERRLAAARAIEAQTRIVICPSTGSIEDALGADEKHGAKQKRKSS